MPGRTPDLIRLEHAGESGLRVLLGGVALSVDPPEAVDEPVVVTWTETERVAGAKASAGPLAADARVLKWLGRTGTPLGDDDVDFEGAVLRATPYVPIPYATPAEAVRKLKTAVRRPLFAVGRVARTLRRPTSPPLAVEISVDGTRVAILGQALHRFVDDDVLDRLVARHSGAHVLVAGTDYDDEEATGRLASMFDARRVVIADLVGPVRRRLGLPVRPLDTVLQTAPSGTLLLPEHGTVLVSR